MKESLAPPTDPLRLKYVQQMAIHKQTDWCFAIGDSLFSIIFQIIFTTDGELLFLVKGDQMALLFINESTCSCIYLCLPSYLSLYAVTALSPQRKLDLMTPAYWKTSKAIM